MKGRLTFTERRRAKLARKVDTLERMEPRSMITESLGILSLGIGLPTAAAAVAPLAVEKAAPTRPNRNAQTHFAVTDATLPFVVGQARRKEAATGFRKLETAEVAAAKTAASRHSKNDWLTLFSDQTNSQERIRGHLPAAQPSQPRGGGGAGITHGGGGGPARGTITPLRLPPPTAQANGNSSNSGAGTGTAVTMIAGASALSSQTSPTRSTFSTGSSPATGPSKALAGFSTMATASVSGGGITPSGGASDPGLFSVSGANNSVPLGSFTNFPLYTLDYLDGDVMFPGFAQLASLGGTNDGWVDLRAQVRDTSVKSYSWDTTGLTTASSMSATNTYRLTFKWGTNNTPQVESVTLTVTDTNNNTEVQTYSWWVPSGSATSSSGGAPNPNWPEALAPNMVLPDNPSFDSQNVTVSANSGALDVTLPLPSYNPNLPGLALTYNSLTADPRPIVVEHHTLDPSQSIPTQVSGQLTFNGTAGTTYYYDTSQFIPGDVQQIALQVDATGLSTGRYSYTVTIGDVRGSTTTTTVNGTATVLNNSSSAIGDGWTVQGLERITSATGGVILDTGSGSTSLWFASGSGGGYTSPAGDFSTLTASGSGGGGPWQRTMPDGTAYNFDSNGRETSVVDRNGLHTTFSYDSGGKLQTITDPYNKVSTFTYDSGGKLQTITDPANRVTTFTHSGGNLTSATLPDSSVCTYTYDSAGRMTQVTDARSKTVTIAYDSAERVSTITRADSTTDTFTSYQERGWTNSGTSGSPAAATLLAEARASHTDPNSHTTDWRPDWRGMGLINQSTDPDGNVGTFDRDANGLVTIAIDRINRITQRAFDGSGNVTKLTYPDGNTEQYTYNGFAEVTSHTDPNNHITSYTYDGNGNLTVIEDALLKFTTMTYTGNGKLATIKDARNNVTSFQYDSQDRLTTITYPDTANTLFAYDSKGNATTVTDERSNVTSYSFDAMNHKTGMTDALGDVTTYTYDSGGNLTVVQAPLSRTTTYAYDALDRLTTITDPLSNNTVYGYDSGGNLKTITDPLSRVTTFAYDAEDRRTVVTDTLGDSTTTTYDAAGQTTNVKDPLSRLTTMTYNSRGWVATVTDPLGNLMTLTYTATGKSAGVQQQNPSGGSGEMIVSYSYDADDRRIVAQDALSHLTTWTYDDVGNRIAITDANNNTTTYAYDSRNRVTTITDPLSHSTVYGYDSGGNQVTVKDPLGHVTTSAYDALNRVTTITDADTGQTRFTFDSGGRNTVVVDPNGNRSSYAYDAGDRVTTLTDALGTATYSYNADNELTDKTDRNSRRTTFAYDSGGRRTNERWLDSSGGTVRTITYTYDADNELTGVTDPDATLTFTYDSGGRQLTQATSSAAGQPSVMLTSGFNAQGDRTSLSDDLTSQGLTTFVYDSADRLTTITRSLGGTNGPQVIFAYDPANRMTSESRTIGGSGTAVNTTFSYDNADRMTTITDQVPGGSILATYVYGYDNADRLTSEQNAEGTVTYGYDNINELTSASGSRTESYGYDSGGNRNTTGYTTTSGNELTTAPGFTYTYDSEGNLSGKTDTAAHNSYTFAWDYRNRLTGVTEKNSGGTVIMQATYTYDALNRRIGTDVDDDGSGPDAPVQTWAVYDGQNTYADFNGSGTLLKRYLYGPAVDQLLARTDSGGTSAWYLTDRLGSVRDVASTAGSVIDHIVYSSFGSVTSETNAANGDRFKFTGREYDSGTAIYDYRNRYYDPAAGRFLSQDPEGFKSGDANLFRYTGNQPTDRVDPNGLQGIVLPGDRETVTVVEDVPVAIVTRLEFYDVPIYRMSYVNGKVVRTVVGMTHMPVQVYDHTVFQRRVYFVNRVKQPGKPTSDGDRMQIRGKLDFDEEESGIGGTIEIDKPFGGGAKPRGGGGKPQGHNFDVP